MALFLTYDLEPLIDVAEKRLTLRRKRTQRIGGTNAYGRQLSDLYAIEGLK